MTQLTNSDDDEPSCANDHENSSLDGKRKGGSNISPWQRMKWTDNMVRLLIMAVYYIGDEAGNEAVVEKKKPGGGGVGGGGGMLQKKGKWKSVSRAMMEKGFYVSPQQCEDKFNDLNKRYKRVNDILGRGTACKVVENQTIPPNNSHRLGLGSEDHEDDDEDCDDEDDEDEFEDEDEEHEFEGGPRKRAKTLGGNSSNTSQALQQLNGEMMGMLQDGSKNSWEKKQWMKTHLVKLEEQGLKFQVQALELEKQRFKWIKFSSKKERELEKLKIDNERKRLENERMMLLLRQKEIELVGVEPQHPSNPSCDTQCEMFNWVTTSTDLEGLELKIMEKDTEICELEYEKKLKEDKIKKLQLKKDKYCDALAGMKTEMEELKTQIRKRRKNERRMYLMLLLSWIVFGFSYVYG
uniref:Myb/SANT-like DNA-binding domain-containing protein n=1 Tax=Chenopodium quinoa TaxID=63459 RepID=A0A803MZR1_CHEQI